MERMKRVPTSAQAGVYSSILHYLQAVKAAGTTDSAAVMKIMKDTPINDMFAKNGRIREDGRMVHDMYLFEVKKPSESKGRWDDYKLLATVPGDQAFQSLELSRCPLVKNMTRSERSRPEGSRVAGFDASHRPGTTETTTNNNESDNPMSANEMVLQNLDAGIAHYHHEPPRSAQRAQSGHDARPGRSGATRG